MPSEAQIEYALRGGFEGNFYPWGLSQTPPFNAGNYCDEDAATMFQGLRHFQGYSDGYAGTAPVCTYERNPFGLCDISGNAAEWALDWYDPAWYRRMPERNPVNNQGGSGKRSVRGGSWISYPSNCRSSERLAGTPDYYGVDISFRCVRP